MLLWWASSTALMVVTIRQARVEDSYGIASMLSQSVRSLGQPYYQTDQIQAWCELLPSSSRIQEMLQENDRQSWVATVLANDHHDDEMGNDLPYNNNTTNTTTIAGYIDWKPSQHELDLLYVHPSYARQGVAGQLYQKVLQEAQKEPASSSDSDSRLIQNFASEGAKPFFEKHNFRMVERREFTIGSKNLLIHNYEMVLYRDDQLPI